MACRFGYVTEYQNPAAESIKPAGCSAEIIIFVAEQTKRSEL